MTGYLHGLERHEDGELQGSRDTNAYNDSVKKDILTSRGHISMIGYSHGLERHEDGKLRGLRDTTDSNDSTKKERWHLAPQKCHLTLSGHVLMTGY